MASSLEEDVERLKKSLGDLPQPQIEPPFVVLSGLPGTGKSFFCHQLARKLPFLVLASDNLSKLLFPSPEYKESENRWLFSACHVLIEELLEQGIPLVFDATNLSERNREYLYRAAGRTGAKLILVWIEAPAEVVRQRLVAREEVASAHVDSEASWEVYQRMRPQSEQIGRNHFVVDTSLDITAAIEKIVRATRK